jgi:hypothetical protein
MAFNNLGVEVFHACNLLLVSLKGFLPCKALNGITVLDDTGVLVGSYIAAIVELFDVAS